ncbi:MAG: peptide-methionine (S)-S-oxide reductase MsrA [Fusobacteriaceae bacterium]
MKTIYVSGGCFWGVENYFQNIKGVIDTDVGYANSIKENPTYNEVCSGRTDAVEACKVIFDENIISLNKILEYFFEIIDPTILNRQGNDIGSQYRTGIYLLSSLELTVIKSFIEKEQKKYSEKIVVEVEVLKNFYLAEEYHQNYLIKNPEGYCHISHAIEKLKNNNL